MLSGYQSTGPGALNIDMSCQDGQFVVENVSFYDDAKVGTDLTADADWKRRGLYIGPTFDTLDVGLQDEFEKFLQERGINETVAAFIPEYCAYKEQQVGFRLKRTKVAWYTHLFFYRNTSSGWARSKHLLISEPLHVSTKVRPTTTQFSFILFRISTE
jgi:hypothetical protein